jgi:glutamate 5-kinase
MVLCNGKLPDVLLRVAAGERLGTLFLPGTPMRSRKHWLAFTARTAGAVVVDEGAARALRERGRSLLPAGVAEVRGRFGIGDPISCLDARGREVARGLANYASPEVERIRGLSTRRIGEVLGYSNGDEVIHRDDLVVIDDLQSED